MSGKTRDCSSQESCHTGYTVEGKSKASLCTSMFTEVKTCLLLPVSQTTPRDQRPRQQIRDKAVKSASDHLTAQCSQVTAQPHPLKRQQKNRIRLKLFCSVTGHNGKGRN